MIFHYSTIIQFAAAIYVTLSFDNILFKSLWSLDYASLINERISSLSVPASTKIEEKLKNCITTNAENIERLSRLRGCYCLAYAVVALFYTGFEQDLDASVSLQQHTARIVFFFYTIFSILGFVVSCFFINRLLHQFMLCSVVVILSLFLNLFDLNILQQHGCFIRWVDNTQYFVLLLIIIPLIFQLIVTWLFTDNYYYILSSSIKSEYDLYIQAINANNSENVPQEYMAAIGQSFFDKEKNGTSDTKITNLSSVFQKRLEKAVSVPSIWKLLSYAFKNILKNKVDELSLFQNTEIKGEEIISSQEYRSFRKKQVNIESVKPLSRNLKRNYKRG